MDQQVTVTFIQAISGILVALIGVATTYVVRYTSKNIKNDDIRTSLVTTEKMAESALLSVISNLSESTKKALADGTIDKDELLEIKQNAYNNYRTKIKPQVEKRLEAHIQDVQGWVINTIESKLESANKITNV